MWNFSAVRRLGIRVAVLLFAALTVGAGRPAYAQWQPGTLLVAHSLTDGSCAISQLDPNGSLLRRFGTLPSPCMPGNGEFRAHLALSGGFLFRSNGVNLNTISQFSSDGTLVRTITPNTSTTHSIVPIARDFTNQSIYMVDTFAGTNVIRHLDDPSTGASSQFALLQYTGIAGTSDLYFGGPSGSQALFALTQTSPSITPCLLPGCPYRVAKINSTGSVQFFDNPNLIVPFIFDIGSLAVDSTSGNPTSGNIYVATGNIGTTPGKIVELSAGGAAFGSFSLNDAKPSLDVDRLGNIFVGRFSSSTGEISVFSPSGGLLKTILVPNATSIFDVLIVPGVPVYVSTFDGHQILSVDGNTGATTVINTDTSLSLASPEDIVLGPDGKIYVCDSLQDRIRRIDPATLSVETVYSKGSTSGPSGPEGPSVSTNGDLYFNTRQSFTGPHTGVWKIPSNQLNSIPTGGATPVNVLTAAQTGSTFGEGTAFDGLDNLLIVDESPAPAPRRVLRSSPPYSSASQLITGLNIPVGVAVNSAGRIFVADFGTQQVLVYGPDGTAQGSYVTFTAPDAPLFMQFDASDRLFVVTAQDGFGGHGKVWRVDPPGTTGTATKTLLVDLNLAFTSGAVPGLSSDKAVGLAVSPTSASFTQALNPAGGVYVANFGQYNYKAIYPPTPAYSGVNLTTTAIQTAQSTYKQRVAGTAFASTQCVPYGGQYGNCVTFQLTCTDAITGNPITCPLNPNPYHVLTSYNTQLPQPNPCFLRFPIGSPPGTTPLDILVAFFQQRIDQTDDGIPPGYSDFIACNGVTTSNVAKTNICLLYDPTRSVQSGAVYPIKLFLGNASCTADFSSSGIVLHATGVVPLSSEPPGPLMAAGNANPDFDFRFDSTLGPSGGYIFNLKTTGLGTGTWGLNFTVTDATTGTVLVSSDIVRFGVQ